MIPLIWNAIFLLESGKVNRYVQENNRQSPLSGLVRHTYEPRGYHQSPADAFGKEITILVREEEHHASVDGQQRIRPVHWDDAESVESQTVKQSKTLMLSRNEPWKPLHYTVYRIHIRIFADFQGDVVAGMFGHNQEDTHRDIDKAKEEINQDEIEDQHVHARFMARGVRPRDHQQNETVQRAEERQCRCDNRPRQKLLFLRAWDVGEIFTGTIDESEIATDIVARSAKVVRKRCS